MGSRGDLQPYLAILLALQRRGHAIQLIGSINFEAIATAHAIPFVPLPGDYWASPDSVDRSLRVTP